MFRYLQTFPTCPVASQYDPTTIDTPLGRLYFRASLEDAMQLVWVAKSFSISGGYSYGIMGQCAEEPPHCVGGISASFTDLSATSLDYSANFSLFKDLICETNIQEYPGAGKGYVGQTQYMGTESYTFCGNEEQYSTIVGTIIIFVTDILPILFYQNSYYVAGIFNFGTFVSYYGSLISGYLTFNNSKFPLYSTTEQGSCPKASCNITLKIPNAAKRHD